MEFTEDYHTTETKNQSPDDFIKTSMQSKKTGEGGQGW